MAVAVILPGFVIAELSAVGRARASRADLELVLRALFYALLLHLVAAPATKALVDEVGPLSAWQDHLAPLMAYVAVVLVIVPVVVGYALGAYLRSVERDDAKRGAVYEGIGARDAGDAWDGLFQKLYEGAWLIIEFVDGSYVGGKYGSGSAVGQSPSKHDVYLKELWHVDATGLEPNLNGRVAPPRGLYVSADQIRSVRVL